MPGFASCLCCVLIGWPGAHYLSLVSLSACVGTNKRGEGVERIKREIIIDNSLKML